MLGDEEEIHRAVFEALAVSLNLFPESNDASRMILRSWGERQIPQASGNENLVFYDLTPDPAAPLYTERSIENRHHAVFRFMPYLLNLVFYGPRALNFALRVQANLFVDGHTKPLKILRKAGIYPVPSRRPPAVSWEVAGSLFRKRTDLSVPVRLLDNSASAETGAQDAPAVKTPPDVILHSGE